MILLCLSFSFFHSTAPPGLYPLSLHDALPIFAQMLRERRRRDRSRRGRAGLFLRLRHLDRLTDGSGGTESFRFESGDRKSTRLNSIHEWISYAVFCLKKKTKEEYDNRDINDLL